MIEEKSGGVLLRGYGLFRRVLTRGFGSIIKTGAYKKRKKYIQISFEIYSPIQRYFEIEKILIINLIKKIDRIFQLNNPIKRILYNESFIKTRIFRNMEKNYKMNQKLNSQKLIKILEEL